ncbi:MAG: threonine synthase [Bacteroidetes bacterium]|nr:threonine synthase [Bacteroidota bacterium]
MSFNFQYECITCGRIIPSTGIQYRCPDCSKNDVPGLPPEGILKTIYPVAKEPVAESPLSFFSGLKTDRYLPILPVENMVSLGILRVGNTPVYEIDSLDDKKLDFGLYLKDDSQNPTFSFKDRASILVSAFAKEKGIGTLVAASTGNAGSSLAGICASQGQKAVILVPASAPKAKLTQIIMYGATLIPVNGNYDTAFDLSIELTEKFGWYNRNTAYNPLTIEGKKVAAFEIADHFSLDLPDRIFIPCGDGVILSGIYKGFEDLLLLGIIPKIPVIVAVQAEGSDNLVRNFSSSAFLSKPSHTLADSISVDVPRNFYMARKYHRKYSGESITVSDREILDASWMLGRNTGLFSEPAGVAGLAGLLNMKQKGQIPEASRNLVLLTGSGLKDLIAVQPIISQPKPVQPNLKDIEKFLETSAL